MPVVNINNHDMYYEIHGEGEPAICIGGWGTFCHGSERNLARGLTDEYAVLCIDYRGIGESSDDLSVPPSIELHAEDVIGLLEYLQWTNVRFVGLVGMGACIAQRVALMRPDLVRCMVNMGCWVKMDPLLEDQLQMFVTTHREAGFLEFQRLVVMLSFLPEYYNENRDKLLGYDGGWKELKNNVETHARLVQACVGHDTSQRLHEITAPSLIVHAGQDLVTGPRTTEPLERGLPNATGVLMPDVAHVVAGREQKKRFCDILLPFLARH
ncbi:MAG: alpha/beta hydrolase [Proteobacteria bacterium]|nr:alpha/beta hydrolase [Pseudomonadota bacterium]